MIGSWEYDVAYRYWFSRSAFPPQQKGGQDVKIEITIEERPMYCDRGRYLAKIFPTHYYDLDHQDGWPRYYFDLERAKAECQAWLLFRFREIPK